MINLDAIEKDERICLTKCDLSKWQHENLQGMVLEHSDSILLLIAEVRRLREAVDVLMKSNEFYAESDWIYQGMSMQTVMSKDLGNKAREARAHVKKILNTSDIVNETKD